MRRVISVVLLGTLVPLFLLEAGLQLFAYASWKLGWRREAPLAVHLSEGEKRVLCVGDSFTYGMGASSQEFSYPAQLEKRLVASNTGPWHVVNRGWPAQNSADVLRQIDTHLVLPWLGHGVAPLRSSRLRKHRHYM